MSNDESHEDNASEPADESASGDEARAAHDINGDVQPQETTTGESGEDSAEPEGSESPGELSDKERLARLYDEYIYGSEPFAATHPHRLGAIGKIFGMDPVSPERCRVLELGTARGTNLIAMAYALPSSAFVGIDLSPKQIELGRQTIKDLGLRNIELLNMDLLEAGSELGEFDYIISHGTLSWVPPEVRAKMFSLCGELLSPNGIAYLSYNTYPGWKTREIFRDLMFIEGHGVTDPKERVERARIALKLIALSLKDNPSHTAVHLMEELPNFLNRPDWYYLHDFIADNNQPFYIADIIRTADSVGLQYFADSELATVLTFKMTPEARKLVQSFGRDVLRYEQYCDVARNRSFRRSLFCRKGIPLKRKIDGSSLAGIFIAANLKVDPEQSPERPDSRRFIHPSGGTIESSEPVFIEALAALAEVFPAAVAFEDLINVLGTKGIAQTHLSPLVEGLLRGIFADMIEIRLSRGSAANELADCPLGSLLARSQSQEGPRVTNLLHEIVELEDFEREVLALLNGESSDRLLLERLFPEQDIGEEQIYRLAQALEQLLRKGLLHH